LNQIKKILTKPAAEMAIVLLCALCVEWLILPFSKNPFLVGLPIATTVGVIFFSHRRRGETLKEIGYRFDNFLPCLRALALPMAAFFTALTAIGWSLNSLHFETASSWTLKKYSELILSALIQQHVLQAFFNRRAQEVWGVGFASVLFAAAVFALLHLPNFWLTIATLLGGLMWASVYQKVPNLFALALSHGLMSTALVLSQPPAALHGMRVGYNYFRL
jgi:membrane protease YdiL (CAAX protease family)